MMSGVATLSVAWAALLWQTLPPPPDPTPSPSEIALLIQAWEGKQYVLVGALFVGIVIALSKTGWFGNWLATKIPPMARPFLAVIVSILTVASTEIVAGVSWKLALLHALYAAATAVLGHQMVVEGLRGGKELLPLAPWHKPPPANGTPPATGSNPKSKTPAPPSMSAFAPMALGRRALAAGVGTVVLMTTGCAAWWQEFLANPVEQITKFIQYVALFLDQIQSIWAVIAPLLGTDQAKATADFQAAVTTVQDAMVAAQDSVEAYVAAKAPNLDVGAVMKPIQDAVAQLMAIYQQWQQLAAPKASVSLAGRHDKITNEAVTIAHWGGSRR